VLSGRGLCDELITRPEESYRLWCVVVCDLETSRIGAPYIYNVRLLRVKVADGRPSTFRQDGGHEQSRCRTLYRCIHRMEFCLLPSAQKACHSSIYARKHEEFVRNDFHLKIIQPCYVTLLHTVGHSVVQ